MAGTAVFTFSPIALAVQEIVADNETDLPANPVSKALTATQVAGNSPNLAESLVQEKDVVFRDSIVNSVKGVTSGVGSTITLFGKPDHQSSSLRMSQTITLTPIRSNTGRSSEGTRADVPVALRPARVLIATGSAPVASQTLESRMAHTADAVDAIDLPDGALVASPSTPARGLESESDSVRWVVPPIRWGGSIGYSTSYGGYANARTTSHNIYTGMNASSFVYAPWFATVGGRLGLSTSSSSVSSSGESGGLTGVNERNRNSSIVGGVDVNMLSASRFPFQAYFDRSDSRASGQLVRSNFINTRFGLRQNYRGADGSTTANGQLDHSIADRADGQKDTVTALTGNLGMNIGIFKNTASARYSFGQNDAASAKATLLSFVTSHTTQLEDNINLSGGISYVDNSISGGRSGLTNDITTRSLQANAFGSWMPEFEEFEDLPLSLSGGVNYSLVDSSFGGEGGKISSLGANGGANYRFTNNLSIGSNGSINQINTSTQSLLLSSLGLNATYAGDPINLGKFTYGWNTGSNVAWQSGSGTIPANTYYGAQLGHSLSRYFVPADNDSITVSLSQNLSYADSQVSGASSTLSTSLGTSYSASFGEQFSGSTSLSLSNTVVSGENAQKYNSVGLGLFGQGKLSQVSSANVNLQINWSEQTYNTANDRLFRNDQGTTTVSEANFRLPNAQKQRLSMLGTAAYNNARFLKIRGLRYTLAFTADTRTRDQRLFGDAAGSLEPVRYGLLNRLEYQIGLLSFAASAQVDEFDGKENAMIFFQVTRQIGSY